MEEKCYKHQFTEFPPAHFCLPCSPSQAWQVRKTDTATTLQILCCRKKTPKNWKMQTSKLKGSQTFTRARKRLNQSLLSCVAQPLHPHQGKTSPCPVQDGQPCPTQVLLSNRNPRPEQAQHLEHGRRAPNTLAQHHTPGGGQPKAWQHPEQPGGASSSEANTKEICLPSAIQAFWVSHFRADPLLPCKQGEGAAGNRFSIYKAAPAGMETGSLLGRAASL